MGNRLYVGNVPFAATNESLTDYFSRAGAVTDVHIMMDKLTGRPRGFAFVTMAVDADAQKAIATLHGQPFEGRTLSVTEARPREERAPGGPRRDFSSNGGGAERRPFAPGGGGGGGGGSSDRRPGGGGGDRRPDRGHRSSRGQRPEREERPRSERRTDDSDGGGSGRRYSFDDDDNE